MGSNLWSWQRAQLTVMPGSVWTMVSTMIVELVHAAVCRHHFVFVQLGADLVPGPVRPGSRSRASSCDVAGQQVARDLLADELVVRLVFVERSGSRSRDNARRAMRS